MFLSKTGGDEKFHYFRKCSQTSFKVKGSREGWGYINITKINSMIFVFY